jgi:hypothetical protein
MLTQIDHIVVVVADLDPAIAGFQAAGFTVTPGGAHAGGDTHNALIGFSDGTYVELLAFLRNEPDTRHYFSERHRLGGGLAEFALLSTDIDRDAGAIAARGIAYPIPTQLGRERPDGVRIDWRMSLPATLHRGKGYPFLIQDLSRRDQRAPSGAGATTHPNGACGVAGVTVVVPDLDRAAPDYRAILDVPPDTTTRVSVAGKAMIRLPLAGPSGQWIALMQTFPGSAPEAYYKRFGEGPYAVTLRHERAGEVLPGDGTLLDPGPLNDARFYL